MDEQKLSHLDDEGQAHMVDVGDKPETDRTAIARGQVRMLPQTLTLIQKGLLKKGDARTVAKIAGILAAKKTPDLIPLCHTIVLNNVEVNIIANEDLPGV